MNSDDELDKLLDEWQPGYDPDPELENRVLHRIQLAGNRANRRSPSSWLSLLISRPLYAGLAAAALVAIGITLSQFWNLANQPSQNQYVVLYRSAIDPIYRLSATGNPLQSEPLLATDISLESTITWLEGELNLGRSQSDRFENLHRSYQDSFDALFAELSSLRQSYERFDQMRMTNDVVDFLAFYDLLQKQKAMQQRSIQMTEDLVQRASEILSDQQQAIFEKLIRLENRESDTRKTDSTNA